MAEDEQQTGFVSELTPKDQLIKFCMDNNVQKGVINELLEKGFDSLNTFRLVEADDIRSQKIPIGQRKLLLHLAKSLIDQTETTQNPQETTTGSHPLENPGSDQTIGDPQENHPAAGATPINNMDTYQSLINTLINQQSQLAGQFSTTGGVQSQHCVANSLSQAQPSWKDPQIHIATATGKSAPSYYDICDFVPNNIEEELVIGGQGDQQVIVKSGPKKPKLENLSLSQWSIANLAILYKLEGEGKLVGPAVMDYLSYSTKFYQLVQKCSLTSVLLFDREYRKLQAGMGFRWGTDVQHLHTLHLQPRDKLAKQGPVMQQSRKGTSNAPNKPKQGKIGICRNFNSDKGCSYNECKYQHTCIIPGCNQKHSATSHMGKN